VTAAQAERDSAMVQALVKASGARTKAVRKVLLGLEVWPMTYVAVARAAAATGVTEIPPAAARAPRKPPSQPCPECAKLRARVAELEAENLKWQECHTSLKLDYQNLEAESDKAIGELRTAVRVHGNPEPPPVSSPSVAKLPAPREPRPPAKRLRIVEDGPDGTLVPVQPREPAQVDSVVPIAVDS
jgi:hypothetical protein